MTILHVNPHHQHELLINKVVAHLGIDTSSYYSQKLITSTHTYHEGKATDIYVFVVNDHSCVGIFVNQVLISILVTFPKEVRTIYCRYGQAIDY